MRVTQAHRRTWRLFELLSETFNGLRVETVEGAGKIIFPDIGEIMFNGSFSYCHVDSKKSRRDRFVAVDKVEYILQKIRQVEYEIPAPLGPVVVKSK